MLKAFNILITWEETSCDKQYYIQLIAFLTLRGKQAEHSDTNHDKTLFDPPPRVMKIKTKINKWGLIKLKSFCIAKETINKTKDNTQNGRKYLQKKQLTRG